MYANSKLASQLNSGGFRCACEVAFPIKANSQELLPARRNNFTFKLVASAASSLVFSTAGESCFLLGKVEVEPQVKLGLTSRTTTLFSGVGRISQWIKILSGVISEFCFILKLDTQSKLQHIPGAFPGASCKPFAPPKQVRGTDVVAGHGCVIRDEQGGKGAVEFSTSFDTPVVIQMKFGTLSRDTGTWTHSARTHPQRLPMECVTLNPDHSRQ